MCVAAFAWNLHPRWRLLLAGNRDEFHARPSAPLARWEDAPAIVAGRDLEAGGTWLGVDLRGRCALVTNVRDFRLAQDGVSRGLLASDFLRGDAGARDHARSLLPTAAGYRPFNLLLVDAHDCIWMGRQAQPRMAAVEPGVHVLSNAELDTPWPKAARLGQRLREWIDTGGAEDSVPEGDAAAAEDLTGLRNVDDAQDFAGLFDALADDAAFDDVVLPDTGIGLERERWLSSAFIRGQDYGTRASTVVAIGHDGRGVIIERRWGPMGVALGQTRLPIGRL